MNEMIFRKKKKTTESLSPIDTIIVIGNGFDRWQGLNTSYADFQTYYHEHLDETLKKFHLNLGNLIMNFGMILKIHWLILMQNDLIFSLEKREVI